MCQTTIKNRNDTWVFQVPDQLDFAFKAMALPVGAYVLVIAVMMWRASALLGSSTGRSAAVGAVLFGLSDTLIALDRFHEAIPGVRYPIILLYWAGQLGITLWAQRQQSETP